MKFVITSSCVVADGVTAEAGETVDVTPETASKLILHGRGYPAPEPESAEQEPEPEPTQDTGKVKKK